MKPSYPRFRSGLALAALLASPWVGMSQTASGPSGGGGAGGGQAGASGGGQTGSGTRPSSGATQGSGTGQSTRPTPRPIANPAAAQGTDPTPDQKQPGTSQPSSTQMQQSQQQQQPGISQPTGVGLQPYGSGNVNSTTTIQPGTTQGSGTANTQATGAAAAGTTQNPTGSVPGTPGGSLGGGATGVIGAFDANGFAFTGAAGGVPTGFLIGPGTVFMDEQGREVPRTRFSNQNATVYYTRSGNDLVATRVVASSAPAASVAAAPISSAGTIREVSPGVLVIEQPGASSTPVQYVNDQTTNYVNQNGEAVSPESVKAGTPVKVFYTKVGDTLVASRIEVQQGHNSALPKPQVETESTTTIQQK